MSGTQVGRTGSSSGRFSRQLLHGFVLFGIVLGLDGKVDTTRLAIHVDDHGFNGIAHLEVLRQVVNTITREFGSTQVTFVLTIQR